jgi:hypothetical protein
VAMTFVADVTKPEPQSMVLNVAGMTGPAIARESLAKRLETPGRQDDSPGGHRSRRQPQIHAGHSYSGWFTVWLDKEDAGVIRWR